MAVALAEAGDVVLVLGKGHEQGQEVGGRVTPFDDRVVLRRGARAADRDEERHVIALTLGEVAAAVGGRLVGAPTRTSRRRRRRHRLARGRAGGDLFVAVAGEHHDAHDFAGAAVAAGARRRAPARPLTAPTVARAVRRRRRPGAGARSARPIASCERLPLHASWRSPGPAARRAPRTSWRRCCRRSAATVAPQGSFNTEVGRAADGPAGRRAARAFLVVEMGVRGLGHIAYLVDIARRDVGVVLNVGSRAPRRCSARARPSRAAKGELVEALRPVDGGRGAQRRRPAGAGDGAAHARPRS